MFFSSTQKYANSYTQELHPYIHQIKMPISHPENCASSYIPCIHYYEAPFHLFFRQQQRNELLKKCIYIWEKPKGKRGKSIPVQKKFITHFLLSSSYHSNKRESCCKEWPKIFRTRTSSKNSTHAHSDLRVWRTPSSMVLGLTRQYM